MSGTPVSKPVDLFQQAAQLANAGKIEAAIPLFQKHLEANPRFTEGWVNLAQAYRITNQQEAAIDAYSQALITSPANPKILRDLGKYLASLRRFKEAVAVFHVLCTATPMDAQAWVEYGSLLLDEYQFAEAEAACRKAIEIDPDLASAYHFLSVILHRRDSTQEQLWAIQQAQRAAPESAKYLCTLARAYQYWGRYEEALQVIETASENLRKNPDVRTVYAMLMPMFATSVAQIEEARDRWMSGLGDLRREGVRLNDPFETVQLTPYYLGYQGMNDRPLAEMASQFFQEAAPVLTEVQPNLERRPMAGRKVRLGFLSASLRQHSVGRVLKRFLTHIDRERFEVLNFQLSGHYGPGLEEAAPLADKNWVVYGSHSSQRQQVAEQECDILFIPEHLLLPATYFHCQGRLAPIQCVTWGHPGTTGSNAIDHWLSWAPWEAEGNQERYTENLVRMKNPPMIVDPVEIPERYLGRAELGLPADERLYVCPQTLFKFHPHFDDLLVEILRQDHKAKLVFIEGVHRGWQELVLSRLRRLELTVDDRVLFLPKLKYLQYLSLLKCADVVLDTVHFSGGTSALDAMAVGAPVVTLPFESMQSRMTAGFYEAIGVKDLIAHSAQHYVELATRIAKDPAERQHLSKEMAERSHVLFDNVASGQEMSDILWNLAVQKLS